MHYCKWRVEWQLTTRVFDLIAASGVGIIASRARIFAERAEISCFGPAVFKDQKKNPENSQGKDFAGFSNGQKRLIE